MTLGIKHRAGRNSPPDLRSIRPYISLYALSSPRTHNNHHPFSRSRHGCIRVPKCITNVCMCIYIYMLAAEGWSWRLTNPKAPSYECPAKTIEVSHRRKDNVPSARPKTLRGAKNSGKKHTDAAKRSHPRRFSSNPLKIVALVCWRLAHGNSWLPRKVGRRKRHKRGPTTEQLSNKLPVSTRSPCSWATITKYSIKRGFNTSVMKNCPESAPKRSRVCLEYLEWGKRSV